MYCWVVAVCSLSFFIFHKLVQVIFPSLGFLFFFEILDSTPRLFWSICLGFGWRPRRHVAIPISSVFRPNLWCWVSALFHKLLSRFSLCTESSLLIHLLGLMCFLHHPRMRYCCLGRILGLCCVLLVYLDEFLHLGRLFHLSLLCFSFCIFSVMKTTHSALGSAGHFFVFFCCSPCSSTTRYCRCDNGVE